MAQFTINIPDGQLALVLDGWAKEHGYFPTVLDGTPNPETKRQFFERKVKEEIKRIARKHYEPPDIGVT